MDADKAVLVVELFPLCDRRGDISRVLKNPRAESGTRADALLFAWLLDLPVCIDPADAAEAVLLVAEQNPPRRRSGRQKTLLRELRSIVEGRATQQAAAGKSKRDWRPLLRGKSAASVKR